MSGGIEIRGFILCFEPRTIDLESKQQWFRNFLGGFEILVKFIQRKVVATVFLNSAV